MTTAHDIIKAAFRIGGITVKGETPDAEEIQDALDALNDLIYSISNDSLNIYGRTEESFALSSGQSSYTIGPGGDFNTSRPTDIISAYVRLGTVDYPIQTISAEFYTQISVKSISGIPEYLYYEGNYPLGKIKLYPAPTSGYTLFLLCEKPLEQLDLNEVISLPPGWGRYLKNQLAIEIASEYGQPVPQSAVITAREAKGMIKRGVAKKNPITWPSSNVYKNIYTGYNNS